MVSVNNMHADLIARIKGKVSVAGARVQWVRLLLALYTANIGIAHPPPHWYPI